MPKKSLVPEKIQKIRKALIKNPKRITSRRTGLDKSMAFRYLAKYMENKVESIFLDVKGKFKD